MYNPEFDIIFDSKNILLPLVNVNNPSVSRPSELNLYNEKVRKLSGYEQICSVEEEILNFFVGYFLKLCQEVEGAM